MKADRIREKITLFLLLAFFLAGALTPVLGQEEEMVVAMDHLPPWRITDETSPRGIDVDILKEISNRLQLKLTIRKCPWKRCLTMIERGDADIVPGLLKTKQRKTFVKYVEPPYISAFSTVFYVPKGRADMIMKYEDLYKLPLVGVVRGAINFEPFDSDPRIKKYDVTTDLQLVNMLAAKRLITIVGIERVYDYLIYTMGHKGQFDKASYRYDVKVNVYMGISKESRFAERITQFNDIMAHLVASSKIKQIEKNYLNPLNDK